jgi:hypothetical protein
MAKASRSNRKQPAFDPGELEDLIFSPAVGTGVSSHLLGGPAEHFPAPEDPPQTADSDLSTVATSNMSTVATNIDMTTVDMPVMATVATSDLSTVATSDMSTVDDSPSTAQPAGEGTAADLWITEQGDLVPARRVTPIRSAEDVITSAEESVYNSLWTAQPPPADADSDASRVVQAGYDYLARQTHLSRRTIQRVVAKLIDKDFIAIEQPADIYQRTSTVYRVYSHKLVLDHHLQRGRSHVAKIGPGFSYVRLARRDS